MTVNAYIMCEITRYWDGRKVGDWTLHVFELKLFSSYIYLKKRTYIINFEPQLIRK